MGASSPGEGAIDWPRLVSILEQKSTSCPVGSEQYSDAVKAMDLDQACRYLFRSVQDVLREPPPYPSWA